MPRITKSPEIRKKEFMDTAIELFNKNGYENTSVDDIVDKMKVAKGLFYWYFDSKDDLLTAILNRELSDIKSICDKILEKEGLLAIERLKMGFDALIALLPKYKEVGRYALEERNRYLRHTLEQKSTQLMVPVFEKILEDGIAEGIFNTRYPHETVIALLSMHHVAHDEQEKLDKAGMKRRIEALQYLLEKLLGAKPGTLDVLKEFYFNRMFSMLGDINGGGNNDRRRNWK